MGVAFSTEKYPDNLEKLVNMAKRRGRVSRRDIEDTLRLNNWCGEAIEQFFRGVVRYRKRFQHKADQKKF